MSDTTNIAWCDSTWNPWAGCQPVSAGCQNCYAEALSHRFGKNFRKRNRLSPATFNAPLKWNKRPLICDQTGEAFNDDEWCRYAQGANTSTVHRRRVFSLSLGDWLDPEVPVEWLADMLDVIRRCPNLDFLLLTKRPEWWVQRMDAVTNYLLRTTGVTDQREWVLEWPCGYARPNIWLGVTVENQEAADRRIPELLRIPARVRFLSIEPLLEDVGDLELLADPIDWVIVGGESGPKARPCDIRWISHIVSQCRAANVPCFVKQLGANVILPNTSDYAWTKHPKGGDLAEWPADLRCQEFPKANR
jgi:protein gp37